MDISSNETNLKLETGVVEECNLWGMKHKEWQNRRSQDRLVCL